MPLWHVRAQWASVKQSLIQDQDLGNGTYRFEPMARITKANGETLRVWCARDAVVLKAMALGDVLPQSESCTHVKGHGGAKAAVKAVAEALPHNRFVIRTDVKQFYESIDQHLGSQYISGRRLPFRHSNSI